MTKRFIISFFLAFLFSLAFFSRTNAQCPTSNSYITTPVSCFNGSDGTITATFTGPKPPIGFGLFTFNGAYTIVASPPTVSNGGYTVFYSNLPIAPSGSVYLVSGSFTGCAKPFKLIGPIIVDQPDPITSTPNIINVSGCFGNPNGSITLNAAGGNGGYSYAFDGGPFTAISSFSGLPAKTYPFSIKDSKGCQLDSSIVISQPTQLNISFSGAPSSPSCASGNDGTFTISALGGTPAYQYSKDNGVTYQSSNVFTNLTAGTYTIKVKDNNNCSNSSPASLTVKLVDPPVLVATVSKTDVPGCFGDNTGQIVINISGGTGSYTFSIDNGATYNPGVSGNNTINNLPAKKYDIIVKDANNCTIATSVTILQPAALTANSSAPNDVSCNGKNDGSFTITFSGGTSSYTYTLNGIASGAAVSPLNITGLVANTYNVVITDSKGCSITVPPVTVSQPAALTASSSGIIDASCNGKNDGSFNITFSGGTSSYTYTLNGVASGAAVSPLNITGLLANTYNVVITDSKGCSITVPPVTVSQPAALTASSSGIIDASCNGKNDGSFTITFSGGTSSYTYTLNGVASGAAISPLNITGLVANTYNVVITDSKGCSITVPPVTVSQPAALTASSSTPIDASCNGKNDGSFTVTFSGGTSSYTYTLNGIASGAAISPLNITGLVANTYNVVITDSKGCSITVPPVTVSQPAVLTANSSGINDASCNGKNDGSFTITFSGGNSGFTYTLNGIASGAAVSPLNITGLVANTYNVVITDSKGCSITVPPVTVSQPAVLTASSSGIIDASCNGKNDGSFTVTFSGGNSGFTYTLNGVASGAAVSPLNITGLLANTYNVVITDSKGCSITIPPVTVSQPAALTTSASGINNASCNGKNDGSFTVTFSGGTSSYTYTLNGVASGAAVSPLNITGLLANTYNVVITDSKGCSITIPPVTVSQPAALTASSSGIIDASCNGKNDGSFTVTFSGGNSGFTYTLNGVASGAAVSPLNITGLLANTYNVVITDSKGCSITIPPVTVSQPAALTASASGINNASCNGKNDGSFTVTFSGGTSSYTYTLNGVASGAAVGPLNITGLLANTYNVVITDSKGCSITVPPVTVSQPAALTASSSGIIDASCNGKNDGSFTITFSGGTSSYTYTLNGVASGAAISPLNITGLVANTYNVVITDSKGCSITVSPVTVSQPAALTASASGINNASCNGKNDGSFTVTFSGGTSSYTYTLNGIASGAAVSPLNITGLLANTYNVVITDSKGCSITVPPVTVSQPAALTASSSGINDASCNGKNDGSFTITFSGGTSSYTYTLNGVASGAAVSPLNITGLVANTYNVVITDSKGCSITVPPVTVSQPAVLTASSSGINNASCNGKNDGSFTVTFSGGTSSYTYTLNGIASGAAISPLNITGLVANTYNVVITDSKGCSITVSPVTVSQPAALTASASGINNASCNGKNDGSFTVTFSGGTSSYTYTLNGIVSGAAVSPLNITGLLANTYNVVITDSKGCSITIPPVTVSQPAALTASSSGIIDASCNGKNDGSFTVTFSGGNSGFTYTLNGVASGAAVSPLNITGLLANTYNVVITDSKGCSITIPPVTVSQPAALTASASGINNASCNGKNDGSFTVTFSGGTSSYTYTLNGVASGAAVSPLNITGLVANTYNVVITDSKGCSITVSPVTISQPAALKFSGSSTNATCNGKSDGTITLKITGGTPNYQYSINGSSTFTPFTNPVTISNLKAGFYDIIVRDTNLCSITLPTIIIRQPNPLVLNASSTNVTCQGKNDGSITLFASGGTSPYKYSIGGLPFASGPRPITYSNLPPGKYDIQVEDGKNCISILPTITITEPSSIVLSSTQSDVTCNGKKDGIITVTASGGTAPFRFSKNGGPFISGISPYVFSNLSQGIYNITVKDTNDCTATLPTVTINEPPVLNILLSSSVDVTGCFGNTNGSITVTTSGGTAPYQYNINGNLVSASSPYTFLNLAAGNYNINVTDSKLCSTILPVVKISQPSHVLLSVSSKTDILGCNGDSTGSISIAASGGTPGYQFSINNKAFQASNTFNNLKAGNYTIVAQDINNCPDTLMVTINQPAILSVTSTKVDPGCGGGNTGSISTNITGGIAPFQYSVNGGLFSTGTGNFSNLPGGNYDIIVMDNGGCKVTLPRVTLASPAILSATINSTNPSTCNSTDGSITISNVSGGSGNYQYSLDGITYQIGNLFSGLANGTYTIYIKDITASCQITQTATLTSAGGIIGSFTKQDVSCNGGSDGQIVITGVSGGSGIGYQYSKDGVTFQASNTFLGLNNGNYVITIKDNGSCKTTLNITINQPAVLQANISASNPIDCTSGNGSITISGLSGGSGNYEFSLTGLLYQASPSFVNLSSGSYTIYIRDASNTTCQITKTQALTAPNAINASLKTNDVSCNGANDGSINIINQTGGSGTYDYSIDGVTFQSTSSFTGLSPNTYTITVRDKSNPSCKITLNAVISTPSALVINLLNSSPSGCGGSSSGSINVSISGGVSPYQYSVNGSPFTKGTGSFTGLAAGNYNITVQDTNLCKSTLAPVTINSSPSLTATITPSGETACGSKDGKIVVSGETGPVGPFQYQINGNPNPAGVNNNTFTGLAPGNYSINVIAANACNYTQSVTITTPCSSVCNITATAANVPVLCNGNTNGQAFLINVAGGSGVYEFNINGGPYQATSNFTGLGVGNDTIGVRDKNNLPCVVKFPVSVTAKFHVSAIIVVNQPKTCNDKGTIKFTNVFGGTAPYTFSVDGTNFFTDSLFLNLNPGAYPATIKDANNCQLGTSINIIGSTGIIATVSQLSPVSCFGGNDGSLKISNVSGGSGTYVYSIDGSNFFGNTTFTNLKSGLYTVYVKDQSGTCVSSYPVTISQPIGISAKTNTVSPTTCNSKDGSIKINVSSGGFLPYSFSLNGNAPQSDSTFSNLGSGNFIIVISDKNGCTDTLKTSLTSPGGLTGVAKVTDASCYGSKDGSVQITNVSGGSGTFEYSIDGINFQTSSLFSNLIGGAYVITIRDKGIPNPCIITYGITIKQPTAISGTVVGTNPTSCVSKDGKIDINNVANGISPYQYSLDSLTYQSVPSFTNLDNGNYKVYIKDANGCIIVYPKTIASPNAVSVTNPTIVSPTCKGSSDGQINLTNVSGGSTPYQYSIDGITYQSSANFTNLKGGNYTIYIKDNSGCIYPFKYVLIDPAGINFTISNLSPANCGAKTGKVQAINTTGGTAPYFYSIDGITYQSNPTFNLLSAGAYKMYVRDNGGGVCPSVQSFNVLGTPPITYKIDSINIGCKGGGLGRITVSQLKGGIKPYQVSIDGGSTFGFVTNDSISFTNLSANNYQLVINYGNGCSTNPLSINITSGNLPITVDVTGANCGSSTGSANAIVTPSSPNYFYSLDSVKYTTSPVFLNLKPGPYIMYVREGQNDPCLKRKPFIIPGPDSLRFEAKIVECNRVYFTNIVGGIKPYKISLDGGKTFVDKGASIFTNSYITLDLPDGDYTLLITDNVGCNTGIKKVKINSKLYANQITVTQSLVNDSTGSIALMDIRGLNKPFSISMDSINWKPLKSSKTPIDTIITHLAEGKYNVYIRDANGCVKSYKDLELKVREFMIPNIFTPNNDGVNDKFVMVFKDSYLPPANTSIDIYNRWGKLVYSNKNYQNDWTGDGHPDGVYYYFAKIPGHGDWEGWVQIWKGPTDNK